MSVDRTTGRVVAVLFDLDGTLLDHEGAVRDALQVWLPSLGLSVDEVFLERWFAAEQQQLAEWRAGRISWAEQRRRRLRGVLPAAALGSTEDELDAVFAGYLQAYERSWRAFEDAAESLQVLAQQGLRLGMLTNGTLEQQQAKLEAMGLADRFEFVLTAEGLGAAKPDPVVYLAACDRFDLRPAHVLHVGDLPDVDVAAAQAAGLHAVLIDRSNQHDQADSLKSLAALPAFLATLNE